MRSPHAILLALLLAGCAMNPQERDNLQRTLLEIGRGDQSASSPAPAASSLEPEPRRMQHCTAYPGATRNTATLHCY